MILEKAKPLLVISILSIVVIGFFTVIIILNTK